MVVLRPPWVVWCVIASAAVLWLSGGSCAAVASSSDTVEPPPGVAAAPELVRELNAVMTAAVERFDAKDADGVLAFVSDQYRTGPFTKPVIREHLIGIYGIYELVRATVRIDDVRVVGDHAWIYSTGEVSGRLPLVGTWLRFLSWRRELEVARREAGRWRLFGYQQ
jgi:hypothetical protein